MKEHFCYRCFQTLRQNQDEAVQCTECGKVYHVLHWENSCINCGGDISIPYSPPPTPQLRAVVRRPIRRRYRPVTNSQSEVSFGEILGALGQRIRSILRWFVFAVFGFALSILIGAYTPRLIRYPEFPTVASYVDNLIRGSMPSLPIWIAASIVAAMGVFVFFPSKLRNANEDDSFSRRVVRLIAVLVLLVYLNIITFDIDIANAADLMANNIMVTVYEAMKSSIMLVQLGTLLSTWLIGFAIRRLHMPQPLSNLPRWIQTISDILQISWHFLAMLFVILLATFFSITLFSVSMTSPLQFEIGSHLLVVDAIHLLALSVVSIISLLFYHPPLRNRIRYTFWPLRIFGFAGCLGMFIFLFRATPPAMTAHILTMILSSIIIALSLIPVYRAII